MKTALVVSLFAACVAAIYAQPLEERFRRGITDPDVKFHENEIDSSLQELVRTKKSPKEKASEISIGKGIQKDIPQTFSSINDKKDEGVTSQVKTSLKDLESEKEGESEKDDADRSRRQQSIFVSPIAMDSIAPNMLFRSSLETQLPPKPLVSQPAIVSPFLERNTYESVPVHLLPASGNHQTVPHSHMHPCTCSCPMCIGRSSDVSTFNQLPSSSYNMRASQLYGIEQQTSDDRVKQMRVAQQQDTQQQLRLQQQVQLLQQQMDQQRAVDQMQQLQIELQKQKIDNQRSAESLDPNCTLQKLANLQLPKDILQQLIMMEQQRVQKIKDCQGKTAEPKELEVLSAIVEKEVELLQKQVALLQKSDADKKKLLRDERDEKKTSCRIWSATK